MKPDYKNPSVFSSGDPKVAKDIIELSKVRHAKIQAALDDFLPEGWTLTYLDSFLNTLICTNGGKNVTEENYDVTRFIQESLKKITPNAIR